MADIPKNLGPYQILEKIGSGGMGVVYKALDARLNRHVAIKSLWPAFAAEESARERFLREARSAAAINHPNVTQIYDIGETLGQVWFAMEYLDGPTLYDMMRSEGPIPAARAVAMIQQAAHGLKAAADQGIIHRDIKPSNLVFHSDGSLKVTDFGLAKEALAESGLTASGTMVGTPHYISPEAAQGEPVDARSDIYALGVTLFEMVSGAPPFQGPTTASVLIKHIREPVPPLRSLHPDLPYPLVSLIQRMLAKRPAARPQDYDELLDQLERLQAGGLAADPARTQSMPVQRSATPVISQPAETEDRTGGRLVGVGLLVIGAALLGYVLFGRGEKTLVEPDPAPATVQSPADDGDDEIRPVSRPKPRPVELPTITPLAGGPAELKIVESGHEITEDGRLRIVGQVENLGEGRATGIKMHVTLTDDDGHVIDKRVVPVQPVRIGPGESGSCEIFFPDPEQNVHIQLQLAWVS